MFSSVPPFAGAAHDEDTAAAVLPVLRSAGVMAPGSSSYRLVFRNAPCLSLGGKGARGVCHFKLSRSLPEFTKWNLVH